MSSTIPNTSSTVHEENPVKMASSVSESHLEEKKTNNGENVDIPLEREYVDETKEAWKNLQNTHIHCLKKNDAAYANF